MWPAPGTSAQPLEHDRRSRGGRRARSGRRRASRAAAGRASASPRGRPAGRTSTALPRQVCRGSSTGLRLPRFWRSFGEIGAGRKRRRIRKLRLLALLAVLGLLGLAAFTFGLLTAVAAQDPAARPERRSSTQANTYVYARERAHGPRRSCAASQARIIVPSDADLAVDEARDRRGRGQALLRAPRRRRARHGARALGRRLATAAPCRAARRSRSSSSRTRT